MAEAPELRERLLGLQASDLASPRSQPVTAIQGGTESLDYEEVVSVVTLARQQHEHVPQQRRVYGQVYSGATLTKIVATVVSGMAIGLTAAALQAAVDFSVHHRNNALLDYLFPSPPGPGDGAAPERGLRGLPLGFAGMLGISTATVLATTLVVHCWAPKAGGGGVALVMALLNGNAIHGLLSARVYVAKLLGTAASRMAGLALGVEGPMIHLGSAVASLVCRGEHVIYRRLNLHRRSKDGTGRVPDAAHEFLFSNSDHRELVSAGAAAGLAAAFGAPIGGVLFALEEATSVWSRKLAWRCFLSQNGMLSLRGITPLTNLEWLVQGPLLIVVSACGGLMGSAFNIGKRRMLALRRRHPGLRWLLLEGAGVASLTAAALTGLPAAFGSCLAIPEAWEASEVVRYSCPQGQYNDLATALMGNAVWVIGSLLSMGSDSEPVNNQLCSLSTPCYYTPASLAVLVVAYLLLFLLASNLIVPGGLFMPCILIGSAFGVLLGLLLIGLLPAWWDIQPGVYAVVCATAMLGAVFRSSISLVVIVVEGTRGIDLLFGVILATIISNWVAHHLHPDGLYEAELDKQDGACYYLRQEPPHALRGQAAEHVMATPVVGFAPLERVETVLAVLRETPHNGFPVLVASRHQQAPPDRPGRIYGRLQGLVLRSQLLVLLRHRAFSDERGYFLDDAVRDDAPALERALALEMHAAAQASTSGFRRAAAALDPDPLGSLGHADGGWLPGLDASRGAAGLSEAAVLQAAAAAAAVEEAAGRTPFLDLSHFMNLAPITVRPFTPADRVHDIFLSLSLRHLCVVDWQTRCLGIITRKDLDHAAGSGPWRATDIAPTPHQSPRMSGDFGLAASPPAGWTSSLVRSLAVPPLRLMEALQQRFSPQAAAPLLAGSEAGGAATLQGLGGAGGSGGEQAGARGWLRSLSEPSGALTSLSQAITGDVLMPDVEWDGPGVHPGW